MLKRIRAYLRRGYVRYMLSYLLLTALLLGALSAYMYAYYRKSVYETTVSEEREVARLLRSGGDALLSRLDTISGFISDDYVPGDENTAVILPKQGTVRLYDGEYKLSAVGYENLTDEETLGIYTQPGFRVIPAQNVEINGREETALTALFALNDGGASLAGYFSPGAFMPEASDRRNLYMVYGGRICATLKGYEMPDVNVLRYGGYPDEEISTVERITGRDYLFTLIPSQTERISYLSVTSLDGIYSRAGRVWLGFLAVMLLLSVPVMGFMLYISRKNLAPIRRMARELGGSEDMETISSKVASLQGRAREMEKDALARVKSDLARGLINGQYKDTQALRTAAKNADADIDRAVFAALVAPLGTDAQGPGDENVTCLTVPLGEGGLSAVLCFGDDETTLLSFASELLADLDEEAAVGMSRMYTDISAAPNAFLEATSAYESRFLMGEGRVIRFEQLPLSAAGGRKRDAAGEIRQALKNNDLEAVSACLARFREDAKSEGMSLYDFRQAYNDIMSEIISQAGPDGLPQVEMYSLMSLSACKSLSRLEELIYNACRAVIEARRAENTEASVADRLETIMLGMYTQKDFSLADAAASLNISPWRLTVEFKAQKGITPTEYLTRLRMEKAKLLLKESDESVAQVAAQCGYHDASAFTRRFKQYASVSPLQYRSGGRTE
ncbi:MAG: helix-turn-helix transcriptional regulator [Clostridiales bacterium]|nr:helix-turn-helix transcriptional regulator [Clostridiales bacterium]